MNDSPLILFHVDTRTVKGRTITSISTNDNSIFVFFKSYSLVNPLVCKITEGAQKVKFKKISPTLEQVAIISNSFSVSVISLKPLLDYDSSSHINSCIVKIYFPAAELNLSNFEAAHFFPNITFSSLKAAIIDAYWWKLPGNFLNLILVETNGFSVVPLYHFPIQTTYFPLNQNENETIVSSAFRQIDNGATVVVSTNSKIILINFTTNQKNEISIEKNVLAFALDPNYPLYFQVSTRSYNTNKEEDWFLACVQKNLHFFDSSLKEMPRNSSFCSNFSLDASKIADFGITKHFLFDITAGNLYARFLYSNSDFSNENSSISCIERDCVHFHLIDYETDKIAVMKISSCEIIEFNNIPEKYIISLIKDDKIEEAKNFSLNFHLDFQYFLHKTCKELCEKKEFLNALNLISENSDSFIHSIKEMLLSGFERCALHINLLFILDKNYQTIMNLLVQKIYHKNKVFPLFEKLYSSIDSFSQNSKKSFHFPSPEEFAKSGLLNELKNNETSFLDIFPPALIFHIQMNNKIETKTLQVLSHASLLDIPNNKTCFSPHFSNLLTMLYNYLPATEESLPFPICSQIDIFSTQNQSKIYISEKNLFIGNTQILQNVDSFVFFEKKMLVLLTNHQILCCDQEKLDFQPLNIIPALAISSSSKFLVILSIAGPIFYTKSNEEEKPLNIERFIVFEGSFVDISMNDENVFGLDDEGQVIDLIHEKILFSSEFIKEIICSNHSLICRTLSNELIHIYQENNEIDHFSVDFKIEKMKSGEKAVIAGNGKILLISNKDSNEIIDYSMRIGTLNDVLIEKDGILLAGSSAPPVRLLSKERRKISMENSVSFTDFQQIYQKFSETLLFGLFKDHISHLFLSVLFKKWEMIKGDISPVLEILNELPLDHSIETVHALISRNLLNSVPKEKLQKFIFQKKYTNQCLLKYTHDIEFIPQQYYFDLLPQRRKIHTESVSNKLLQKHHTSIFISSNQLNHHELVIFSCGHNYEREDLLRLIQKINKEQNKKYIKEVNKFYALQTIPMQCPKCLQSELEHAGLLP